MKYEWLTTITESSGWYLRLKNGDGGGGGDDDSGGGGGRGGGGGGGGSGNWGGGGGGGGHTPANPLAPHPLVIIPLRPT